MSTSVERIRRIAVVGGGYMGTGIAQLLATTGCPVAVSDLDARSSAAAVDRLQDQAEDFGRRELMSAGAVRAIHANVRAADSLAGAVADADLVVEAVSEDVDTKLHVLSSVEAGAPESAILATNTSSIPVATLSAELRRPERFLGCHWFNPAQFVPAVELVAGPATAAAVIAVVERLLRAAGKSPATVRDCAGFVANRLQFALFQEAARVLDEGLATAEDIDTIVRGSFGFRLPFFGPFAIADMAGLDVYASAFRSLEQAYGSRFAAPRVLERAVDEGRHGVKNGAGLLDRSPAEWQQVVARRDEGYVALAQLMQSTESR